MLLCVMRTYAAHVGRLASDWVDVGEAGRPVVLPLPHSHLQLIACALDDGSDAVHLWAGDQRDLHGCLRAHRADPFLAGAHGRHQVLGLVLDTVEA